MNRGSYRFTIGKFSCFAISDGHFNYPLASFFAHAPEEELKEALHQHNLPADHISTPYTCLLVDTGQHRVIIDTGAGNLGQSAAKMFPSVDHTTTVTGQLLPNIKAMGIAADEIDTVVITHAHPDHVGGTLDEEGKLIFTKAHYYIARQEWEFWTSDAALAKSTPAMVHIARHNLEPLSERLTLIDDGFDIVPGIQAIATPGHTPGHMALVITSEGEQLLHISDVVLHPLHLEHPDWTPAFDISAEQAADSKNYIFNRVAEEQTLVFAHHFPPFPNLGYVQKQAQAWKWKPIRIEGALK